MDDWEYDEERPEDIDSDLEKGDWDLLLDCPMW
jgi:hypothetical protein